MRTPTAIVVVLLVILGTLAFVPSQAGATADGLAVDKNPFTTGCTVTANATANSPGNDLTFAIDGDDDGSIAAEEHLGTVTSNDTTGAGSITFAPREYVDPGGGTVDVAVVEETTSDGDDDTSYPVTSIGGTYDQTLGLTVDGSSPTITNYSVRNPTGTDVEVSFNASEDLCTVKATVAGTQTGTLETADFTGVTSGGGYRYNATFFPDGAGNYSVTLVTARDGAGNNGATNESAATIAGSAKRNEDEVLGRPATVFLGETDLDLRPVTTGGTVQLVGVSGAAEGTVVETAAADLDVTAAAGFETGGYTTDGDDDTDLFVRDPQITDLTVTFADDPTDIEVTNGSIPADRDITVGASFTFDAAEALDVSVVSASGVDVTPTLATTALIPASGKGLDLAVADADLDPGTYTVTVEGTSLSVSRSATVRVTDRETTLSLSRTAVTRGETVRVSAFGAVGGNVTVRVHETALADGYGPENATELFGQTGDVESRMAVGGEYAAVDVLLGRDGIGTTLLRTERLGSDEPVAVEVVPDPIGSAGSGSPADAVPLSVADRSVTVSDAPATVAVGEDVTVAGTAPEASTVKAYALVDAAWVPLEAPGTGWASTSVGAGGSFTLDVDSSAVIAHPDRYRVAVVADPDFSVAGVQDGGTSGTTADDVLSRVAMGEQVRTTVPIRSTVGSLSATLSRGRIAATGADHLVVSGSAPGADAVHLYRVGPRGTTVGTTVSVETGRYEHEITGVEQRGPHTILVISPGRDGTFAGGPVGTAVASLGASDQGTATSMLVDRYTGPGVDDPIVERSFVAASPAVSIAAVTPTRGAETIHLTVAGTSNREAGHPIEVAAVTDTQRLDETVSPVHTDGPVWNATLSIPSETTALTLLAADGDTRTAYAVNLTTAPSTETPHTTSPQTAASTGPTATDRSPSATPTESVPSIDESTPPATSVESESFPPEPGGIDPEPVLGAGAFIGLLAGWRWLIS